MTAVWIDSHCHLHLTDTYPGALERARSAGIEMIVTVGIDPESNSEVLAIATEHAQVWAAVGVHPNDCAGFSDETLQVLRTAASHPRVVGVGETGLDYYREGAPRSDQERAFRAQISLAKELDKALVIHVRDSHEEVFRLLAQEGPPERLVFHCFSGDAVQATRALDMGGTLSFAGNLTFPRADDLREAAKSAPLDRLLVETDSPFLTPVPHRGKPNEPAHVALVGEALAEVLGRPVPQVAEATSENARRIFSPQ